MYSSFLLLFDSFPLLLHFFFFYPSSWGCPSSSVPLFKTSCVILPFCRLSSSSSSPPSSAPRDPGCESGAWFSAGPCCSSSCCSGSLSPSCVGPCPWPGLGLEPGGGVGSEAGPGVFVVGIIIGDVGVRWDPDVSFLSGSIPSSPTTTAIISPSLSASLSLLLLLLGLPGELSGPEPEPGAMPGRVMIPLWGRNM